MNIFKRLWRKLRPPKPPTITHLGLFTSEPLDLDIPDGSKVVDISYWSPEGEQLGYTTPEKDNHGYTRQTIKWSGPRSEVYDQTKDPDFKYDEYEE